MSKQETGQKYQLTLGKKIGFIVLLCLMLLVVAEGILRLVKMIMQPPVMVGGDAKDCDGIVFVCFGDSMTFGLGAYGNESYPMQLVPFFHESYPGIRIKVYNNGIPGFNTSEGIDKINDFFKSAPDARPDYAFILYGINNRWNLQGATFWEWDKLAKKENYFEYLTGKLQLKKTFKVFSMNEEAAIEKARHTSGGSYRKMLEKHGWNMFFNTFDDELLSRWIAYDLLAMAKLFRKHGVEPILLTYHFPIFPELNVLIRKTAFIGRLHLIDIEKPTEFYNSQKMFAKDKYHLNGKGYNYLAQQVIHQFSTFYEPPEINQKLMLKKQSPPCKKKLRRK